MSSSSLFTVAANPDFHNYFHPISTLISKADTTRYCIIRSYGDVTKNIRQILRRGALNVEFARFSN